VTGIQLVTNKLLSIFLCWH